MTRLRRLAPLLLLPLIAACVDLGAGAPAESPDEGPPEGQAGDLPVGQVINPKADGHFGAATTCKDIPVVEPLAEPAVVISLDGLTLRLYDRAGDYDRVFPIGVGAIEEGVSLTPASTDLPSGTYFTQTDHAPVDDGATPEQARWGWNHRCRMWWTSAETGQQLPVFAGLPFIRLAGHPTSAAYGIHGPIDNYTNEDGGTLRRGYVSHGCVRMEADAIKEVWGRIQGRQAEVRVQTAVERDAEGDAVDPDPWMLADCAEDADCAEGLSCRLNPFSGRGFCTQACDRFCPDRHGHPSTFCVADPDADDASVGHCTSSADPVLNNGCRRLPGFVAVSGVPRVDHTATRDVCLPGSEGWIGDRCLSDDHCESGLCTPIDGGPEGICTEPCDRFCPDKEGGYAPTFCVSAPDSVPDEGGICVARCFNDDDCAAGTTCQEVGRFGQPEVVRGSCVP